jgi:hypothetical protein
MPEPTDPLRPDPVADALRALDPAPAEFSRDRLLFEAGKAAAHRPHWGWPSSAAFFAGLAAVLAYYLTFPEAHTPTVIERERVVEVRVPVPVEREQPEQHSPLPRGVNEARHVEPDEAGPSPEAVRMYQVRRDVLRWGEDMLAAGKPTGPAPRASARDLDRWLDVPPGTLTAPYQNAPRLFPKILGDD